MGATSVAVAERLQIGAGIFFRASRTEMRIRDVRLGNG